MKPFVLSVVISLMGIVWICSEEDKPVQDEPAIPAAERTEHYVHLLEGKRIALVGNHSSRIGERHLVDTLLDTGIQLVNIFSPEHGFRGTASAGETVEDGRDSKTGLPVISLYGAQKKPRQEQLDEVDAVVFDIQDVGVRFYTYLSTLHLVMEACAEASVPLIVLDRPNPNAHYIDGPVLDTAYSSFVGKHPVPVVYGMTIGEYARMINGEHWLRNGLQCDLTVIPCEHYTHQKRYHLPVHPSPNLPNERSVLLYPSLCFFEGTVVSVGRGTEHPFTSYGHPELEGPFEFTPHSNEASKHPKLAGEDCYGFDLSDIAIDEIRSWRTLQLKWLLSAYDKLNDSLKFFSRPDFFDNLAGTDQLRKQIERGMTEEEIRTSWSEELNQFRDLREKYLLY